MAIKNSSVGVINGETKEKKIQHNHDIKYLEIDDFLELIGPFGKSQKLLLVMFSLIIIPSVYQTLIMSFVGSSPSWKCVGNGTKCSLIHKNTTSFTLKDSVFDSKDVRRCNLSRDLWEYIEENSYSIVTEWDLICKEKEKAYLANSAMFVGWAIGAVILGFISDRFGRKMVLFPSITLVILATFASAFAHNFWLFFVLRLIVGVFQGGVGLTLFVMASELVGPKYRSISGTLQWFAFTFALCIMGIQAKLLPKWRTLQMVLSVPYLFILVFYKFIPESVRWCRVNDKMEQAEEILKRTARINNHPWPNAKLSSPPKSLGGKRPTIKDVFVPWSMGISTLIQCFGWFVNGMVYYGISLASDNLGGDMYRDFVLTSLVEIPANILVVLCTNKFGRKPTVIYSMIVGGLACIGVAFIPNDVLNHAFKWSRVGLGMLGKLCITVSFNSFYIWSVELYPTIVRSQGMGLLSVVSRLGGASAPWVAQFLGHVHVALPFGVMGGLTLASAITLCGLKETMGVATSETLDDALAEVADGEKEIEMKGLEGISNNKNGGYEA